MVGPARLVLRSAAVCLACVSPAYAQPAGMVLPSQAPVLETTGTGAITGAVVDALTGRPISGAIVTLQDRRPGERARSRAQASTPSGRFAFIDLPASDFYFVTAEKPGYLAGGYRRTDPRGSSAPIALADDAWVRDVEVALQPPGSISGRVVDERGEPVVGVYVRVLPQMPIAGSEQLLAGPAAETDDRGVYRIADLGPGRYLVSVPSVQANLPAGTTIGRAMAGSATSSADLRAARQAAEADRQFIDIGGGSRLLAGRFAVPPAPGPDGRRQAYPVTFHPGVSTPGAATRIDLAPSQVRTNVDIRLQPVPTARLRGVLRGPADAIGNQLLRLLSVGLEPLGQGSETATTVTLADGRFEFVDVPSGDYLLELSHSRTELAYAPTDDASTAVPTPVPFPARSASAGSITAAPPGVALLTQTDGADSDSWARVPVAVAGRDIDGLEVAIRPAVIVTGRIQWASGDTPPGGLVRLTLEPAGGERTLGFGARPPGPSGPDEAAAFTLTGLRHGEYVLRIMFPRVTIASVALDGRDYTHRPLDTSGGDISGLVVTLTTARSTISGSVSDASSATAGIAVMVFPVDREGWRRYGFNPTRLQSALATAEGQFRIDGLPAGEYFLLAVPASEQHAWTDASYLEAYVARATRVRLDRHDATVSGVMLAVGR